MALREKFGKLVLLEEIDKEPLGVSYRAARLGATGLDRIVTLFRYSKAVSSHTEARARLMEQARQASRLPIPGLLRVLGIGRAEQSYYTSFELMDGRTVRGVVDRSRQQGFPFAADNALMVASRAAVVLEALHGRKDDVGTPLFHGLVKPAHLVVSWEGDVKLAGLGVWPALRGTDLLSEGDRGYLAPEQAAGEAGDARADIFMLAQVLLEILTGQPPDGSDPLPSLGAARYTTATGDEEPIPEPILEIVRRALAPDPSDRYPDMSDMRKAVDTLLFSGDFTPTTFNLAFFMHSLFREDMERESAALEEASQDDYSEFLKAPEPAPAPSEGDAEPTPATTPAPPAPPETAEEEQDAAADTPAESLPEPEPPAPETPTSGPSEEKKPARLSAPPPATPESPPEAQPVAAAPDSAPSDQSGSGRRARAPGSRPRVREGSLKFARKEPKKTGRGLALVGGLVLVLATGSGLGYLYSTQQGPFRTGPTTTTLNPEAAAALARVQELESRLADLEREKADIEAAQAEEEATSSPTPSAEARAAEQARRRAEARRRARAEADRQARVERAQEEIRRLEAQLADQRLVAQQRATQQALQESQVQVALPAVATPPPTPKPIPVPVRPGDLVAVEDPRASRPEFVSGRPVRYPLAAQRLQRAGWVRLEALVDENGEVTHVKVLEVSAEGLGFEDAAERQAKSRKYRPARKNDVPVKMWIPIRVNFSL